jgi:hypothetical protein
MCLSSTFTLGTTAPCLTRGDKMTLFGDTIEALTLFGFVEQMYACFPFGNIISHRAVEGTSSELCIIRNLGLLILPHLESESEDFEFTKCIFPQFRKHFI